jgi:hypothetical protein
MRRAAVTVVALAGLALAPPAGAVGERSVAPDGRAVAYVTNVPHLAADTDDGLRDVYSWNRGVFDLASQGPGADAFGATPRFVSDDGTRVLFETRDPLLPSDTDNSIDLYERAGGVTSLVSTGPSDTGAETNIDFGAASNDGTRVYFDTTARLVPEDTDDLSDIYLRTADGTVTLASPTPAGVGEGPHSVVATSRNGLRLLEATAEGLAPGDNPGFDIYERFGGQVTLVSRSLAGPVEWYGGFEDVTPDARSVLVWTRARMTSGDQNEDYDLYQFSRGRTTLVTSNSEGVSPECEEVYAPPPLGSGRGFPCRPGLGSQTDDGDRVLFTSSKELATKPGPLGLPVTSPASGLMEKVVTTGATRLVDEGGFDTSLIANDGSRYLLHTVTSHSPADTDDYDDLYLLENGRATLASGGRERVGVYLKGHTPDLTRVFFETIEQLVPEDTSVHWQDTYVNTPDGPRLALVGPAHPEGTGDGGLIGPSDAGDRWFFASPHALVAGDADSHWDLYVRHLDGTTRVLSP